MGPRTVTRSTFARASSTTWSRARGSDLPRNEDIEDEVRTYLATFHRDTQPGELLALREREPAPMALLVLRVEGLSGTALALGSEAAHVLRRKLAVRLRAALRASDVVAAIAHDAFAVLLAWIDAPADAMRVADKLRHALQQPIAVAGQAQAVSVAVGLSQYPEHGRQAGELLHRALGQAGAAAAALPERGRAAAANDE